MIFNDQEIRQEIQDLGSKILDLRSRIDQDQSRIAAIDQRKEIAVDLGSRIAELELKMSKLWSMLIEVSPNTGKDKLTRFGRKFGGRARLDIR